MFRRTSAPSEHPRLSVGFGSHYCVLRKAVLAKTSLVRSRSRNGFTTDGFNGKGQKCPLRVERVQQV